jgi:hypothetical protein
LEVGPNREVVPYVSDNRPEKFGDQEGHQFEFQILGVENLEKNQRGQSPLVYVRHRLTRRPVAGLACETTARPLPTTSRQHYQLTAATCRIRARPTPLPLSLFPAESGEARRLFSIVSFSVAISLHNHL